MGDSMSTTEQPPRILICGDPAEWMAAAMAEIERLRRELTDEKRIHAATADALIAAEAERDAMREDVERYRVWRSEFASESALDSELLMSLEDAWDESAVDAAIDAARKATP
jgi:3-hydroxy-3-methylglutaryl CoA synthase